jgi:hypothetical protein
MVTHGAKPAGIDSGVALREYKDQTTQRFAQQEKSFEQLVLDTIEFAARRAARSSGEGADDLAPHAVRRRAHR